MQILNIKQLGKILVTGGTGFIGSALTKSLVDKGASVRVLDNNIRGDLCRLDGYHEKIEYIHGDITKYSEVYEATKGIDTVFHLAFINGTSNFYKHPEKVLEVGVKGALTSLDAAMELDVKNYIVTSSSEVYQDPTRIPTCENERIIIPNISNPRYSYSGGKIITELLAIHYTAKSDLNTIICRPHNFYGPDMGVGHVIPQFVLRMKELSNNLKKNKIEFPIQGTGDETRSFCYIDDAIDALLLSSINGRKGEIYHLGTENEITIKELAINIADILGIKIIIKEGELLTGGTKRRCPDISKISKLGYSPKFSIAEGLEQTVNWYIESENKFAQNNITDLIR